MLYRPRVGMGFLVVKNGKILVIRRKHSHGKGTWAPPGGHLDFGESFEDCAIRKLKEETGLTISESKFEGITNDLFEETGKHYITVWVNCKYESGEPIIGSAREISASGWYSWDTLPQPFFLTFRHFIHKVDQYGFASYNDIRGSIAKNYKNEVPDSLKLILSRIHGEKCTDFELPQVPRVGVGLILYRGDRILMIKRTNPHGLGAWAPPGGHMEYGETPEETAAREVFEETGLKISNLTVIGVTNDFFKETSRHYITIWMEGRSNEGDPFTKSPSEISTATWLSWNELPKPYFLTFQHFMAGDAYLFPDARKKYSEMLKVNFI